MACVDIRGDSSLTWSSSNPMSWSRRLTNKFAVLILVPGSAVSDKLLGIPENRTLWKPLAIQWSWEAITAIFTEYSDGLYRS